MYVADLQGNIVYTVENNKVYEGKGTDGRVIYTLDGAKIRKGEEFWSPVVGIWQGNDLIITSGGAGVVAYRLEKDKVIYAPKGWIMYQLV